MQIKDAIFCKSLLSKGMGLMFRLKPTPMVFCFPESRKVSLHMFCVFFPIDVLYLDSEKKVIELKENLMPFGFYMPKNKANFVVELPKHSIRENKIKLGESITFA